MDDFVESDPFDDVPLMGGNEPTGLPPVENTVNLTGVYVMLHYYDMSGVQRTVGTQCGSDGYFRIDRPSDFASIYAVGVDIRKAALPSPGKYSVAINCHTNAGGSINYKQFYVGSNKNNTNANVQQGLEPVDGLYNYSEFAYRGNVNLGVVYDYFLHVLYDNTQPFGFSFDGYIKINFTKLGSGASVDFDTPGSGTASEDLQQGMADNSAQQVEQGNTIIELIKNTIQTISSQLTAFWNQLAGEFTNLYNKLNQQHSEQLEADRQNTDQVTGAIEEHGNFIIEGLKSLFIPSDEYFKQWFDDMYAFFNDRLGFLMLPVDLLKRLVDIYGSSGSPGIPFPEFRWVDGTVLIPEQIVGFDFLETDWGKEIQTMLHFIGNVIMIGALLDLMHRKFEEVLKN